MGSVGGEEAIEEAAKNHEERIRVSIRIRPLNDKEIARNDVSDWECINDTTIIYRNNISVSERSLYPTAYSFGMCTHTMCLIKFLYHKVSI
jgi:centromeric protein E